MTDETASLAAGMESLRRSAESTALNLTAGLATIDLVQKRFTTEIGDINRLLDDAISRTAQLRKSLE